MFRHLRQFAIVTALLLTASTAIGNVNLRNGNFYIGYTDVIYTGGFQPRVERVYNSKTPFKGIFGWGWGNEYEVYIKESIAGSVIVHEFGGGAENVFWPEDVDPAQINEATEAMVKAAQYKLKTPAEVSAYREKLKSRDYFRGDEWSALVDAGKLVQPRVAVGARLFSNRFSYQQLTRTADGYVRNFNNGRVETFNNDGKLIRVEDKNNNFLSFEYDSEKRLKRFIDNFGRSVGFAYTPGGLVASITRESDGARATYRYDEHDNLIWSRDVDGNEYTHAYDARHNMTRIGYADSTSMEITYNRSFHENVASVKDRDGTRTIYSWEQRPADKGWLGVAVMVITPQADTVQSRYEYTLRQRVNGSDWTQRMVVEQDGERTETVYNECCGLPLTITRSQLKALASKARSSEAAVDPAAETTRFEYNEKGQVTLKETSDVRTVMAYDEVTDKVSRVEKTNKVTGERSWSAFVYDPRGNLAKAENQEGTKAELTYDANGRIQDMITSEGTLTFTYNRDSKPTVLKHSTKGTIVVEYNADGGIKKVSSETGRETAIAVTTAFQKLLDLIRPAGVTLSF